MVNKEKTQQFIKELDDKIKQLDKNKPTIIVAAGGTAGHINPAIAIANALIDLNNDLQIVFCGSGDKLERQLVARTKLTYCPIEAKWVTSKSPIRLWQTYRTMRRGSRQAMKLLDALNVKACLGAGGYVCVPLIMACRKKKIKYYLHEQNAYPGRSISILSKGADTVFISFAETKDDFPKAKKVVLSGNPINEEFLNKDKNIARKELGIDKNIFYILVTGGSLGAERLNKVSLEIAKRLQENKYKDFSMHLVSGQANYEKISKLAEDDENLKISDYVFNMPDEMAAADLIICRAGASTCTELQALGKPSILVPYPYAIADHQTKNARILSDNEAGFLIPDSTINADQVIEIIIKLIEDKKYLDQLGENARKLFTKNADKTIAEEILSQINLGVDT